MVLAAALGVQVMAVDDLLLIPRSKSPLHAMWL
jgi:hypothetical protein